MDEIDYGALEQQLLDDFAREPTSWWENLTPSDNIDDRRGQDWLFQTPQEANEYQEQANPRWGAHASPYGKVPSDLPTSRMRFYADGGPVEGDVPPDQPVIDAQQAEAEGVEFVGGSGGGEGGQDQPEIIDARQAAEEGVILDARQAAEEGVELVGNQPQPEVIDARQAAEEGVVMDAQQARAEGVELVSNRESSLSGAVGRGAREQAFPTLVSLPAAGFGMKIGAAAGTGLGGPVGTIIGGLVGAIGGGLGGGMLGTAIQNWATEKLGLHDNEQYQADMEQHPYARFFGGLLPSLAAFQPGKGAHLVARGLSSGISAGTEAGMELVNEGTVDPAKVAMQGAAGAVAFKPTRLGEAGLRMGENLSRPFRSTDVPIPHTPQGVAAQGETPPEAAPADPASGQFRPGRPDQAPTPTVAQEKAEAATSAPLTTARGVAASRPPPPQDPQTLGNETVVRSERDYGKQTSTPTASRLYAGIPEDQRVALAASLDRNALGRDVAPAAPEGQMPVDLGLVEAIEAQQTKKRGLSMQGVEAKNASRPVRQPQPAQPVPEGAPPPPARARPPRQQAPEQPLWRREPVDDLVRAGDDGRSFILDPRVPDSLDINGQPLNPQGPLGIRAMFTRGALEHYAQQIKAGKMQPIDKDAAYRKAVDEAGMPAERAFLQGQGLGPEDIKAYYKALDDLRTPTPGISPDAFSAPQSAHGRALRTDKRGWPKGTEAFAEPVAASPQRAAATPVPKGMHYPLQKLGYKPEAIGRMSIKDAAGVIRDQISPDAFSLRTPEPAAPVRPVRPPAAERAIAASKRQAPQPEVTAAVTPDAFSPTRPKVVQEAIAHARAKGMTKVAEALEAAPAEKAGGMARKVLQADRNRTGEVKEGEYKTARVPSKPATVEGAEGVVTARSKADAERKGRALKAAKDAFDQFAPKENETPQDTVARVKAAHAFATAENGKASPLTYRAKVYPAGLQWLRDSRRLLGARPSPKTIAEFVASEKLLRSGRTEDVATVRQGSRIEGDIAKQRRPDVEQAAAGRHADEGFEVEGTTERTLDMRAIEKMTDEENKVVENLIADFNKREAPQGRRVLDDLGEPEWKRIERERAEKGRQRTEEIASLRKQHQPKAEEAEAAEAAEARKVDPTDDIVKKALEDLDKAAAKGKASYVMPLEPPKGVKKGPKDMADFFLDQAKKFARDNKGAGVPLHPQALTTKVREWVHDVFGTPLTGREFLADSLLAKFASTKDQRTAALMHAHEADVIKFINDVPEPEGFAFLNALETIPASRTGDLITNMTSHGVSPENAKWMASRAPIYRALLDKAWVNEQHYGSAAEYVDNYFPHIFKGDQKKVAEFINSYRQKNNLGPTWFQKDRVFDLISEARKAGFETMYRNPADMIVHRLMASEDMKMKVSLLRQARDHGLAIEQSNVGTKGNLTATQVADWAHLNAPDNTAWRLSPDLSHLWQQAIDAQSLWKMENGFGSAFRAWMKFKNVWVPIKLGASLFHPLHVLHVHFVDQLARELSSNKPALEKMGAVAKGMFQYGVKDPILAFLPNSQLEGAQMMRLWNKQVDNMSPDEKFAAQLFQEAGTSPHMAVQHRIKAKLAFKQSIADFKTAINNGDYSATAGPAIRTLGNGFARGMEHIQKIFFEVMIPRLKATSLMRASQQLLIERPDLIHNAVDRGKALRAIGKQVDNRYGEMFYDSLFWNKRFKELNIGGWLSLGWNLGQVREFGGAAHNLLTKSGGRGTPSQRLVYDVTNKGTYAMLYVAQSMLIGGAMTMAMTGTWPTDWLDYFFPKAGRKNPDGSDARLSMMMNTREIPMIIKHAEEHGNWLSGLGHMMWSKMILQPLVDAWSNKDYFGNQLRDPHASLPMQLLQTIDSELGNLFNPVSVSGIQRVTETGGGGIEYPLSVAGFSPAAAYISRSGMQNKIAHAYGMYRGAGQRPYEQSGTGLVQGAYRFLTDNPTTAAQRREAKGELNRALAAGDEKAAGEARQKLVKSGMSPTTVSKMMPGTADTYMFAMLPIEIQRQLVADMSKDEFHKYVRTNKAGLTGRSRAALIQQYGVNEQRLP